MDCKQIQKKLILLIDNNLSTEEQDAFAKHIQHCPDCEKLLNRMQASLQTLPLLKQKNPNPYLFSRIEAQIIKEDEEKKNAMQPVYLRILKPATVTLFILAAVIGGFFIGINLNANVSDDNRQSQLTEMAVQYQMGNTNEDLIEYYYFTEE